MSYKGPFVSSWNRLVQIDPVSASSLTVYTDLPVDDPYRKIGDPDLGGPSWMVR